MNVLIGMYNLAGIEGEWTLAEMLWLQQALADYAELLGGVGYFISLMPRLTFQRGTREGILAGEYNRDNNTITITGWAYSDVLREDQGIGYGTFYMKTLAHEMTHGLVDQHPYLRAQFELDVGWGVIAWGDGNEAPYWTQIPPGASDYAYGEARLGTSWAGEEDFAEYIGLAIYRPELIVDQGYQKAIWNLRGWLGRQYIGPGPGR